VPRIREVGGNKLLAVFKTLFSWPALQIVWQHRPDLLLTNGPGTCMPLCMAAYLLRVLGLHDTTLIYVESWCRTKSLSTTGRLLYPFADRLVVQWEDVKEGYPAADLCGWLY